MNTRYLSFSFLLVTLFSSITIFAQHQNALYFDGANDAVKVPAASALVANSPTKISLSLWVKPLSLKGGTNTYHGFCGIRNDANCDFYMLQLNDNTVEVRYRNSANKPFTIKHTGLSLNTWQHFAMTYDGAYLKFYTNGSLTDSVAASGDIATKTVDLTIGHVIWNSTVWYLKGSLDEVGLWSKALTASEVKCVYEAPIDTNSTGLELYYDFNQGIASSINTSITALTDAKKNINGNLSGIALKDTVSNFVKGVVNYTPQFASFCPGASYTFFGSNLNQPGMYSKRLPAHAGCDSVIVLELDNKGNDVNVTQNVNSLHANQNGVTYQWLKCNPYTVISGATAQDYTPTTFGDYAVVLTGNGCTDTSACVNSSIVGLYEKNKSTIINLYPNPANKELTVQFSTATVNTNLSISDVNGREVLNLKSLSTTTTKIDVSSLTKGIYFIRITNNEQTNYQKLIIE